MGGGIEVRRWRNGTSTTAYLLLLPSLLFLSVFTYYPAIQSIYLSFFEQKAYTPVPRFIGWGNYLTLARDPVFWKVLRNNAVFALGTIPAAMLLALAMAMFVNRRFRLRTWYRVVYFHPTFIPLIAAAALWLFIFVPRYGLLDQYLSRLFGLHELNWLGDPRLALPAMMILTVWKNAGYFMIFFLAGLQNISQELYEAAAVEGANPAQRFRYVTLPLLTPSTMFVLIIAIIGSFQWVDQVWMLTEGGPNNATNLLLYYIYVNAFKYYDVGYGAVLTVVLLLILFGLSGVGFRVLERKVHYEA